MDDEADPGELLGIDAVVAALRALRLDSLQSRRPAGRPPKLPSRRALSAVLEALAAALFPNRLGQPGLVEEGIEQYVGHMLDVALRSLLREVLRELRFAAIDAAPGDADVGRAADIVRAFAAALPEVRSLLDTDIVAAWRGDPAATSIDEVLVCYPGITAILHHRLAHVLYRLGATLNARMIAELAHSSTGINIHPGARIGPSFFIDHGTGVAIGETAVIGRNVRLYQAVTLGAKRFREAADGVRVKGEPRHPVVEDDVVIYAGATVLGRVTIGHGSTIGGNVWLTRSVPPGSSVAQAHALTDAVVAVPPVP